MRIQLAGSVVVATCCWPSVAAQAWSQQELRERVPGFLAGDVRSQLQQIAELVAHRQDAFSAVCASIQGDHREYLLKIERLLDQLADDRWAVREDAERQLVEVGGRALAMIGERKKNGATLEERVRAARIETDIADRGTEEEEREIKMLRGLVAAAPYLGASERLANALISATGHTDPIVVDGALRALGAVGGDDHAAFLVNRFRELDPTDSVRRTIVLAALAELRGSAGPDSLAALVAAGELTRQELLGVLLDVRARPDATALLEALRTHEDPIVAVASRVELPPPAGSAPQRVRVLLGDRSEFVGPLLGVGSDAVRIADIESLPRVRLPRELCASVVFEDRRPAPVEGSVRVFTKRGSLISGKLRSVDPEGVSIESPVFGAISILRAEVQGIALDPELDRLVGASSEHDRVRLTTGDLVDGVVQSIDDARVVLETGDGTRELGLPTVAGVLFRRPQAVVRDNELFTRVDLASGDRLLVHLAALDTAHLGFVMPDVGPAVVSLDAIARLEFGVGGGALWGFTLVADYSENAIFELDDQQQIEFKLDEMYGVWDAECLDNGNLLVVEFALGRVIEMKRDRTEIWSFDKLKNPYDADRLPNGNTLIADTYGGRVIEVDPTGEIVWIFDQEIKPLDVERLANGNTLIADGKRDRILEVDADGNVAWEIPDLEGVWDVDRLANGNTLVTQRRQGHRVFEIDREGKVVFEITDLTSPSDADRLPNGHTLVAEDGKVREFDRFGNQVWVYGVSWAVEVNRY